MVLKRCEVVLIDENKRRAPDKRPIRILYVCLWKWDL